MAPGDYFFQVYSGDFHISFYKTGLLTWLQRVYFSFPFHLYFPFNQSGRCVIICIGAYIE